MRTKEQILPELEALIVEYMQAGTEIQSLMLDSFVLKARGTDLAHMGEPGAMGTTIWMTSERQDIFKSIGLAGALVIDVDTHYQNLIEEAEER